MKEATRDRVREYLERSSALSPALLVPEDHVSRGNAHMSLGEYEEALDEYDSAIALRPTYINALYNRGGALLRLGRYDEAEAAFAEAVRQVPLQNYAFPDAWYGLSLAQYERYQRDNDRRALADALENARQATERGNSPEAMYLRAKLHCLSGELNSALEWLRKVLALNRAAYQSKAQQDPDFASLRNDPRFRELVGEDEPRPPAADEHS